MYNAGSGIPDRPQQCACQHSDYGANAARAAIGAAAAPVRRRFAGPLGGMPLQRSGKELPPVAARRGHAFGIERQIRRICY